MRRPGNLWRHRDFRAFWAAETISHASRRFVVRGVIPFGGRVGGSPGSATGLRETILVGAVGGVLAVVPILLSPIRSVGRTSELDQSAPIASASSPPA